MNNDNENTEVLYSIPGETEPIQVDSNLVEDFLKDYPDATLVNPEGDPLESTAGNGTNSTVNNIPQLIRNPNDGTIETRPLKKEDALDEYVQNYQDTKTASEIFIEEHISQFDLTAEEDAELDVKSEEDVIDGLALALQGEEIRKINLSLIHI